MRRLLLLVPLLYACAKGEEMNADSAAMAATPAALTEADVAGTWSGTLMPEGSDSVIAHWTVTIGSGSYRLTTMEAPKDTSTGTYVIEGDSSRYMGNPYADPNMNGMMVIDAGTTRFSGNQISGRGMVKLASNPDSVLMRYHFTGTKAP